jgi:phosphate transport system substrate-binding protein
MRTRPSSGRGPRRRAPIALVLAVVVHTVATQPGCRAAGRTPGARPPTDAAVRVDGSTGVMPLVAALARAYETRHPGTRVVLGRGLGSAARLRALLADSVDIALTSQEVAPGTLAAQGLAVHAIAQAAVVFAVPAAVPVAALTRQQLCDAYAGRVASWRQLGGPDQAIVPHTRPDGEVDGDVAMAGVPCLRDAVRAGAVRAIDLPEAMAEALAGTAGALGMTSLPFVDRSGGRLHALALDGVVPSAANVRSGAYPLVRRSLLLTRATASPATARFLAFVRSPEGAGVITANGAVPVP